jgi:Icc-related predicted phosphoesterase
VHGNFDALGRAMARHPEVPAWLCVGDLASRTGTYPDPPVPLYWIKGNNEDFDRIAAWQSGAPAPPTLRYIPNGTAVQVGGIRVAGVGGTYAPTWFDVPADELPRRTGDDKRRHFVLEEIEACARLRDIDILLTHEAPRPFPITRDERIEGRPRRRLDAGKAAITDLIALVSPRLHLCGHHHRFVEMERAGVPSICLDRVNRSYLLIEAPGLAWHLVPQAGPADP